MSVDNWPRCIGLILGNEGHFQKLASDAGNWTGGKIGVGELVGTNWGIAAASHPGVDIVNLTRDGAVAIYAAEYWTPIHGGTLPVGVDACTFDDAVNSGDHAAITRLQRAVGTAPDGSFGPMTAAAVAQADPAQTIQKMCDLRLAAYQASSRWNIVVTPGRPTTYGDAWTTRIAHVRASSLAMRTLPAPAAVIPPPPEPKPLALPVHAEPPATPISAPTAPNLLNLILAVLDDLARALTLGKQP